MSLFDWFSGLFGSNGSEVNQNNENIIAQDVVESVEATQNQPNSSEVNQTSENIIAHQDVVENMDTTQSQSPDNLDIQIRDEHEAEIQESSS